MAPHEPDWLRWAREMQSIAQAGLTFCKDPYDRERYEQLRALAARAMAAEARQDARLIESLYAAQDGYATPKVDVRGAVFRDGRILMVREAVDAGRWTLPGGWADVNESPTECVVKEVLQESGFEVHVDKLAAVWDRARHPHLPLHPFHVWKFFFLCSVVGGEARTSLETTEVAFFAEPDIPDDLSRARVLPFQVARMFEHARQPHLPTEFD